MRGFFAFSTNGSMLWTKGNRFLNLYLRNKKKPHHSGFEGQRANEWEDDSAAKPGFSWPCTRVLTTYNFRFLVQIWINYHLIPLWRILSVRVVLRSLSKICKTAFLLFNLLYRFNRLSYRSSNAPVCCSMIKSALVFLRRSVTPHSSLKWILQVRPAFTPSMRLFTNLFHILYFFHLMHNF